MRTLYTQLKRREAAAMFLALMPVVLARAQGRCSVSGMTLDEALAEWQNAQKKAQMDKNSFLVLITRQYKALFKGMKGNVEIEEMGVVGNLSVNGTSMGQVVENEALRVKAGEYKGVMRYGSRNNFVQGPLGVVAEQGDFLLEIAGVPGREALLVHTGTKPWHSKGCVLAGAAEKKTVNGKTVVSISEGTTLRNMRKTFYGTDGEPNACPNKTVRVTIKDI